MTIKPPDLPPRAGPQPRRRTSFGSADSSSLSQSANDPPPEYEAIPTTDPVALQRNMPQQLEHLSASDPRTSSTQSLVPSVPDSDTRRTLLIVYIHGFYGDNQSFRSFPAHVHEHLRHLLSDSHTIHSKIYPRYKTYKAIDIARDKLSAWLEPHESPTTDVILVGHSMGGLLAADVVLKPNPNAPLQHSFKHRILGTISLDSPFLGLHPGIVVSGISSLFQPAQEPSQDQQTSADTPLSNDHPTSSQDPTSPIAPSIQSSLSMSPTSTGEVGHSSRHSADPNFNPPFFNDDPFREQPLVKRLIHFAAKHKSEGILNAVGNHLLSHLEFGGCLADYSSLVTRYKRIRALEDAEETGAESGSHPGNSQARVRFVNYYTLSSGRPKPPKKLAQSDVDTETIGSNSNPVGTKVELPLSTTSEQQSATEDPPTQRSEHPDHDGTKSNVIAPIEPYNGHDKQGGLHDESSKSTHSTDALAQGVCDTDKDGASSASPDMSPLTLEPVEPMPITEDDMASINKVESRVETSKQDTASSGPNPSLSPSLDLPPIPDAPEAPTAPDFDQYTDKDARKQAEKEHKRVQKSYENAVKDRVKAIREREKLVEKHQKRARKESERLDKKAQKELQRLEKDEKKRMVRDELSARQTDDIRRIVEGDGCGETSATTAVVNDGGERPKKLKKFCALPSKTNGKMDSTWIDVYMNGVDEVGAHCGLFFLGRHYDQLIGDVSSRIQAWVQDDMSTRAIMSLD